MLQHVLKSQWINNLRALATFGVIIVHVAVRHLEHFSTESPVYSNWWVGNIYDSFVRFCVPVFLMLTGALLLGKDVPLGVFLKKRFSRVLIPFLFWGFVFIFRSYDFIFSHPLPEVLDWIYGELFIRGIYYHFWFVYMIIGLYLFIPILNKWILHSTEKEILYFLGIWLVVALAKWPFFSFLNTKVDLYYFAGYAGYLVLGYYLSVKEFTYKYIRAVAWGVFIGGVGIAIVGTWYVTSKSGFSEMFYDYLSLNVIAASTGIFILFKTAKRSSADKFMTHIIDVIAKYSYGIYLVHMLVLFYLADIKIDFQLIDPVVGVAVTSVLCLAVSTTVVWLVSKVPVVGKYISG